jgi:hypothetical protein
MQACAGASKPIRAHPGAFERIQAPPSPQHLACAAKQRASSARPLASRHSQRTRSAAKGLGTWRRERVGTRRCEAGFVASDGPARRVSMWGPVHARARTCERPHHAGIQANGGKGRSAGLGARLIQARAQPSLHSQTQALSLRYVIDSRPARLGNARMGLAAGQHPARTCGACIPKSERYIYSSCSRIILLGCSPITILKIAPNS